VPIFLSSDLVSIESGEPWYDKILEGMRTTQVLLSVLSPASIDRRWINFEAGVGIGQDSRVIPVTWRGQSKGEMGMPLGRHHARDLSIENDVKALLTTLASICNVRVDEAPIPDFLRDVPKIEIGMPFPDLAVTPYHAQPTNSVEDS
jgi:hypothetical protein